MRREAVFCLGLAVLAVSCFSQILAAEEAMTIQVVDVVNSYAFNPNQPDEVKPLFIGDTIPEGWILYLPSANSLVTFHPTPEGQEVTLQEPGFYWTSGSKADLSSDLQEKIKDQVESFQNKSAKQEAENLLKDAQADTSLEIDDPLRVPSPST